MHHIGPNRESAW